MLRKDPFVIGEYYHLYNRGVDKREIFKSRSDFERFIMLLYISNSNNQKPLRLDNLINQQHKKFEEMFLLENGQRLVSIGAWCLMPNHFHILIKQEIEGGITKFMKKISTAYSMFFNIKYDRQGSLFSGRFKSKLVGSDDIYLKYLFAYIHMNPLSIGFSNWENEIMTDNQKMKNFLLSYKYSSYQDYLGVNRVEKVILNKEVFPDYFQVGESFEDFIQKYQGFYLGKA